MMHGQKNIKLCLSFIWIILGMAKTSIKFPMLLGMTLLKNVREVQMKLHAETIR
jgi:hypothetical protein